MKKFFLLLVYSFFYTLSFAQWVNLNSGIQGKLNAVHFENTTSGIVVGETGIYRTTDGGSIWTRQFIQGNPIDSLILEESELKGAVEIHDNWFVVGKHIPTGNGLIFKMPVNLGWQLNYTHLGRGLNGIGIRNNNVVAVGDSGTILYTAYSNSNWAQPILTTTRNLYYFDGGTNYDYIIGGDSIFIENSSLNLTGWVEYQNIDIKQLEEMHNEIYAVNHNQILKRSFYDVWSVNYNYKGSLNGTSIAQINFSEAGIATENGILISKYDLAYWERQPSANGFNLNDIFFIYNNTIGYAVGENGVVLKTTNKGGPSVPYVSFSCDNGSCVDSTLEIHNRSTPGSTYKWKLDGTVFSTQFQPTSTTINTVGSHVIRLVVSNGTYSDSTERVVNIVYPPNSNKTINVMSPLLCKSGNSDIIVTQTDPGVIYRLHNLSSNDVVDSNTGNGGDVLLNTGVIIDSTWFAVMAKSPISDCEVLIDSVHIGVEHTEALFHCSFINAIIGQDVHIYNNSKQAMYYNWSFGSNASITNSSQFEEIVSYNQLGATELTLIATSQYGCVDTAIGPGPFIYNPLDAIDNCWAFNLNTDSAQVPHGISTTSIKVSHSGNIIIGGHSDDAIFKSRVGVSSDIRENRSSFVASYTNQGVLNWLITLTGKDTTSHAGNLSDLVLDENDNIAACGNLGFSTVAYTNDGKQISMKQYDNDGYLFVLDSLGVLKWYVTMDNAYPSQIDMDSSANIYVGGSFGNIATFNSTSGSTVQDTTSNQLGNVFNIKYDTIGEIKRYKNCAVGHYMVVDKIGNIYVVGQHNAAVDFGNGVILSTTAQGYDPYILKYDTNGIASWAHSLETVSPYSISTDDANAVAVSEEGDVYMVLNIVARFPGEGVIVPSTSLPDDTLFAGRYALVSYDANGNYRWGVGIQYSYIGEGVDVTIDKEGNVYAIGYVVDNQPTAGDFTSTDTNRITLPVRKGSFFISKYSKNGNLIWASLESGMTSTNEASQSEFFRITTDDFQNLFVTGYIYTIPTGYAVATDTILLTRPEDSFIAKFSPSACLQADSILALIPDGLACVNQEIIEIPIAVPFSLPLGPNNVYRVELSDSFGSFSLPQTIGILNSNGPIDTIIALLPALNPNGTYFIRVVSSQPAMIGNQIPLYVTTPSTAPIITLNSPFLQTSATTQIQWYFNGSPIVGANQSTYFPTQNGDYYVGTGDGLCIAFSDTFNLTTVGVLEAIDGISIYPNPVTDIVNVNWSRPNREVKNLILKNTIGQTVLSESVIKGTTHYELNMVNFDAGIYILQVQSLQQVQVFKILKR